MGSALKSLYLNFPICNLLSLYIYTILQKSNGEKIDVVEQITCYQMAHQPSVILLDHLVMVHAALNTVIVEVLQLIVNVPTALTIEQVISQIFNFTHI